VKQCQTLGEALESSTQVHGVSKLMEQLSY